MNFLVSVCLSKNLRIFLVTTVIYLSKYLEIISEITKINVPSIIVCRKLIVPKYQTAAKKIIPLI